MGAQTRSGMLFVSLMLIASCGRPAELQTVQEQRAGEVSVSLLSETGELQEGNNELVLEFRDAPTGELVPVEGVRVEATMPMPGMAPMIGTITPPVEIVDGRYELGVGLTMVGGWNLVISFDPDQRVQFNVSAY